MRKYFNQKIIQYPDVIEQGQKNVLVEWFYEDLKRSEIQEVRKTCKCQGDMNILEDRITLLYNDNTTDKEIDGKQSYPISRKLVVLIKDGRDEHIINPQTGQQMPNPEKEKLYLTFHATVVKD